jgi:hypothetical protein
VSGRNYPRLGWREFGRLLVSSGDLDPVYVMLHGAGLKGEELNRFLIGYWCFYHAGVAANLAEVGEDDFYPAARQLYREKCPRGFERRHFRGEAGLLALDDLERRGTPSYLMTALSGRVGIQSYEQLAASVQEWRGFGPWIAWKAADMLERLGLMRVDFSGAALEMYEEPRKGALLIAEEDGAEMVDTLGSATVSVSIEDVTRGVLKSLEGLTAPPRHERPCNIQEVETVLCKYKAHRGGHYPLYNDTVELHNALAWARGSTLAQELASALPALPESVARAAFQPSLSLI